MTIPTAPAERIDYSQTLDHRTKMLILFGVLLGLFLSALDQTIVSTAMPRIVEELDGLNLYSWVTTAYLLVNTSLVPIYGKLSDLYGRKPILMFGIFVFLLGSALCGMAGEPFLGNLFGGGMMQLVVFRGVQGLGGAALGSVAFAIIADLFEPADRPKYQGLFGAVFGLSSVIGPLLGGWLTDHVSWRWVFYVNLPLGLLALAFLWFKMPRLQSGLKATIDWLGAGLILVFAVPLLLALTWGADGTYAWGSPTILTMLGVSFAALAGFIVAESKHPSPIIPLQLFKNPTFAWGSLARFLFGAAFIGAILFLSLYLVQVQGVSATKAGTATLPLTFGLISGAILSGQLASRLGKYKPLMLVGLSVMILGFWLLSGLSADTTYGGVIVRMVVLGLGIGPALPLYTTALQLSVKPWEIGVATSAGQFFQQLGSTIGVAIFGAVLTSGLNTNLVKAFEAQAAQKTGTVASTLRSIGENIAKSDKQSGGVSAEGPNRNAAPKTDAQIKAEFKDLRVNVTRAMRTRDAKALAAIQKSDLPAAAKKQFEDIPAGGVAAGVKRNLQETFDAVAAAVNSGNAARVQAVAANPQLPAELRERLSAIPAPALRSPAARAQIVAGLEQGLLGNADRIARRAQAKAINAARAGVNQGEQIALASARAAKVAFADTVAHIYVYCMGVGVLALLATLLMPNLDMPRRGEGEKVAPAHVEL